MARIINGCVEFISADPDKPYGLGESVWILESGYCKYCGAENELHEVEFYSSFYDGCLRETPYCPVCQSWLPGKPKNTTKQHER